MLSQVKGISIEDYSYDLPDERIAKYPADPRDSSRLLLYRGGEISATRFDCLADSLADDTMLVYNNTRVIHARLFFHKESGARIEIFCLEPLSPADYASNFQAHGSCEWECLVGNLRKWKGGTLSQQILVGGQSCSLRAEHLGSHDKVQRIRFSWEPAQLAFGDLLEAAGQIPIPPYLNRESEKSDETTYQTVYSRIEGSVAAPTAGLHFTPAVLSAVDEKGIPRLEVTLHVSASTFQPVKSARMEGHPMHIEFISVERSLIETLLGSGRTITAVGTTSVRTLESLYWFGLHLIETGRHDNWVLDQWYPYEPHRECSGREALQALRDWMLAEGLDTFHASTRLLIAPGYRFRLVKAMLTNFHQPGSTLLLLVSAFVGEEWRRIYRYALDHGFRFLSYGDSSLLQP